MEILKNGKIIPMVGEPYEGDIAIENGKIHAMGVNLDYPNAEEINVSGCFVLPGFVDAHCHIGMWEDGIGFEGADDKIPCRNEGCIRREPKARFQRTKNFLHKNVDCLTAARDFARCA